MAKIIGINHVLIEGGIVEVAMEYLISIVDMPRPFRCSCLDKPPIVSAIEPGHSLGPKLWIGVVTQVGTKGSQSLLINYASNKKRSKFVEELLSPLLSSIGHWRFMWH